MKQAGTIILIMLGIQLTRAQELNCQVKVMPAPALQIGPVEREIFSELEGAIYDYMNTTRWTADVFEIEERINILITVMEVPSTTTYSGKIQVQSTRPVFNTSYNTVLLNYVDEDFTINYLRGSALLPIQNFQYRDNLTAILKVLKEK